jgi:hypothetical protein
LPSPIAKISKLQLPMKNLYVLIRPRIYSDFKENLVQNLKNLTLSKSNIFK